MRLAEELDLPLLTVIDTAGAALSKEAEEGGLAGEIARCLNDLVGLQLPHGVRAAGPGRRRRGTGPAAGGPHHRGPACVALLAAARGGQRIVYRDTLHGAEMAQAQGVTVSALAAHGIVDHTVAELPDAAEESPAFCRRMARAVEYELASLRTGAVGRTAGTADRTVPDARVVLSADGRSIPRVVAFTQNGACPANAVSSLLCQ